MYKRILVPLDGLAAAEAALPPALQVARSAGGTVILVHVVVPVLMPPLPSFAGAGLAACEPAGDVAAAEVYLQETARALAAQGVPTETAVLHGVAADEILACAHARQVDLLILSAHAGEGVRALLRGRTADAILARAAVPVMVIHPPKAE